MDDRDTREMDDNYPFEESYEEDPGDDEYGLWDAEIEAVAARTASDAW
jgi:hypothetical protein